MRLADVPKSIGTPSDNNKFPALLSQWRPIPVAAADRRREMRGSQQVHEMALLYEAQAAGANNRLLRIKEVIVVQNVNDFSVWGCRGRRIVKLFDTAMLSRRNNFSLVGRP